MTTDLPDEPPEWLHARIMTALAPHLEQLRQEAADKDYEESEEQ
ncbi:hypothetical protein FHR32_005156 [Streptosporangium album]|uniref:Uncharacterized protein n=1 Tax=Streptosporangium album TaxID=47479 RepID=A0A7W7RYT9_9ACTN|nr:hypothetical protein [Streptosporangium album]MBB4940779.1 hypothetical protein [Streptosporangium album]